MTPEEREEIAQLRRDIEALNARLRRFEQGATASSPIAATPAPASPAITPPIAARPAIARQETLERRIGSQWLNRIGIVAVLFGVAYFLKIAIENEWIGPLARVLIGIIAGIVIFVWSEQFHKRGSTTFSHSLKTVALGVLYLSLWAGFHLYHLLPAWIAFCAMVAVTATTLVLSLRQNAEVLATMAVVGGLVTPALVSTGGNHEVFLFSYLALLTATAALLTIERGWFSIIFSALLGTAGYFGEWYSEYFKPPAFAITLVFVCFFFGAFLSAAYFSEGQRYKRDRARVTLLLAAAAINFVEVYRLFEDSANDSSLPWMLVAQSSIYWFASRIVTSSLVRRAGMVIGLVLFTSAIPIEFRSYWITFGWLLEAAALCIIGWRKHQEAYIAAFMLLLMAGCRLVYVDKFSTSYAFANLRALFFVIAIVIAAVIARQARLSSERPGWDLLWYAASVVLTILTFVGLDREFSDALQPGPSAPAQAHHDADVALSFTRSAVWMIYGAAAMALGFIRRISFYRYLALAILAITIAKVFLYDVEQLNPGYRVVSFIALGVILLAVSYAYQKDWLSLNAREG